MHLSIRDEVVIVGVGVALVALFWAFAGPLFAILALAVMLPFYLKVLFA